MTQADSHPSSSIEREFPLVLVRPLVIVDIQTTGPDHRTARIVRLSTLKFEPDGSSAFRSHLINPKSPITPGATNFHGITDEDVVDRSPFAVYAKALADYLEECDLAGFGIRRFHLRVLKREFEFAGIDFDLDSRAIVDAMEIFHRLEPRDFNSACRRFIGEDFDGSSDDEARVNAVSAIIRGQLEQLPEMPTDPEMLEQWATGKSADNYLDDQGRFTLSDEGDPIINFGRYRGHSLYDMSETNADYLRWIATNESFTDLQRKIAADAAEGVMPDLD